MSWVNRSESRPILSAVGLLVAYYAFPVKFGESTTIAVASLLLTAAGLSLLAAMMVKELQNVRHGDEIKSPRILSMALILLVMAFSLSFFLLNQVQPNQIADLESKTDALYFTLATMATVGFGDVHAEGQVARALVCGLIVFNVVVVATLFRAYATAETGKKPD
jgi:voltage-gated potassium channel